MKKVAVVLHGQPRYYIAGCINIFKFLLKQNNIEVDFFYHCWIIDEGQKYNASSPQCYSQSNALDYQSGIENNLKEIYNPIAYEYEKQINNFDISLYNDSIAYENTKNISEKHVNNINNVLSVNYSRNKAKNLFEDYVNKTNTKYDFVILTRFDIHNIPNLKLEDLDDTKVNLSNNYGGIIFNPALMIMPQEVFIKWFDIFDKLKEFINDSNINEYFNSNDAKFYLNDEELIAAKYLYTFKTMDNISKKYYW